MELLQKKGKHFDRLEMVGDRLMHEWNLGRDQGLRSTIILNIDPVFGRERRKTEGKLPYFVLSIIPLLFVLFADKEKAFLEALKLKAEGGEGDLFR